MRRYSTFSKGGIHPNDNKFYSKDSKLEVIPVPESVIVPLSQHIGAPATCLKAVGDSVEKGEKIGQASSFVSSNIFSPVRGTVTEIKKIVLPNGNMSDALVIKSDAEQPDLFKERYDWSDKSPVDLLNIVGEMGIVGQGGATFPTQVKLKVPEGVTIDALIINCVECEPYLTADYRLILEKMDQFFEGVEICQKIINPKKVIIALEANKLDLADALTEKNTPFEIKVLKMKYPQGDEKQLIKACMDREIPSGKLPSDVGAVVVNAGTAWAIEQAVVYKKPLFERIVSVTGPCIKRPANLIVPIGTPISKLIDYCDGFSSQPEKVICGGPMMGFSIFDLGTPILKGNGGLVFLDPAKPVRQTACLSCGRCVEACPIGLEPTIMYRLITHGRYKEAMEHNLMDCKECGCCAFSCPAKLDLVQSFKLGKKLGRSK